MFLLKKHPKGTTGSGSVDHIAFLAQNPGAVRERIQKSKVAMHFRSFPDAKLFQIFLKDPDDITIELNFLGEVIDDKEWQGKGSASAMTLTRAKASALPSRGRIENQGQTTFPLLSSLYRSGPVTNRRICLCDY